LWAAWTADSVPGQSEAMTVQKLNPECFVSRAKGWLLKKAHETAGCRLRWVGRATVLLALLVLLLLSFRQYNIRQIPEVPIPTEATDLQVSHGMLGLYRYVTFSVPESYPSTRIYTYYDAWLTHHGWRPVSPAKSGWTVTNGWVSVDDATDSRPVQWDMFHAEWEWPKGPYHVLLSLDVRREKGKRRPQGIQVSLFVERHP